MLDVNRMNHFENMSSHVNTRAHILYIYNELERYIANAFDFIVEGLAQNEVVAFVDIDPVVEKVKGMMKSNGLEIISFQNLMVMKSNDTYLAGDHFDVNQAENLINRIKPYLEKGHAIRTWGNVPFPEFESTLERIKIYENISDELVSHNKMISVCAYNGLLIPAYVQNELMRSHKYFMTDSDFSVSPLYKKENERATSSEEIERLRILQKQNKELSDLNNHLTIENNIVKLKNELIAQSEQKIRHIIDQLPIPTVIRRGTCVLLLNEEAKKQFYIKNGRIEEEQLHRFFDNYDINSALLENKKLAKHQFTFHNGSVKYYLVKSIQLNYEDEPATLHSFVDITHEKENEFLMVRSEKMNIVGELAASIAHELRNPLTAIKGFFQILTTEKEENELYYSVIENELARIEQISSELLTLAKPHSENKSDCNIIKLIDDVMVLLTPQANMKNIEMVKRTNTERINLNCENTKIKQVFINLIKNSIDSMKNPGKIVIVIDEQKEDVIVKVIDQGCGIPKELLDKLGEPFYTTKEKGTGLGLMVCFQIIESHKGSIQVESAVNEGTTFTITLPLKSKV
ncbi:ATP-binding protein [Neobacillus sp. Marseille-QA0830]